MEPPLILWLSFLAGLLAPISSPCVLIMYPGYLAFLAGNPAPGMQNLRPARAGLIISCGIFISLLVGGIIFSSLVQSAGETFRTMVTTAIYLILLILSLLLIFGTNTLEAAPLPPVLRAVNPLTGAFLYGALFGIIILPCNAAVLVLLLALAATAPGFWTGLDAFVMYGAGLVTPLLILAVLSRSRSSGILRFITRHQRGIRVAAGLFMLLIALWYLVLILVPG